MLQRRKGTRTIGVWTAAALVAANFAAAGCDDVLGTQTETATITFRSVRGAALALQAGDVSLAAASVPVTGGGHTVDVQQVDLLLDRVKLERVHGAMEVDSDEADSDESNDETFRSGAATVTLPLDSGSVSPFSQPIPAGTYDELQMNAEYVRLKGTYDGQAFDVTVPVSAKIETRLDPPFTVATDADRPNVTVKIDVPSWFENADGTVVDPRRLATDATLRAAFRNRIRASFRAFEDSDKDGDESDSDSDRG